MTVEEESTAKDLEINVSKQTPERLREISRELLAFVTYITGDTNVLLGFRNRLQNLHSVTRNELIATANDFQQMGIIFENIADDLVNKIPVVIHPMEGVGGETLGIRIVFSRLPKDTGFLNWKKLLLLRNALYPEGGDWTTPAVQITEAIANERKVILRLTE